jgi:rhamnulokinase
MPKSLEFIAFDLGAESGRAILGSFDGNRLSLQDIHRFTNLPVLLPDGIHWDALRLWSDIQESLSIAVRKEGHKITSLGLDTWGVDFGLLDRQGALLANPFHYRDSRTDGMIDLAFKKMPREQIFDYTGIQFMQLNTLFQLLSMVENHSPVLEIAETFLTMPDLFNYWLTGARVSEFSITTTTQCYDPQLNTWSEPVLKAMGIPIHIFPKIVPPGTVLGVLRSEIAERTGAGSLTVIAPACHDTGSAVAAVPSESDDYVWISSGTWSVMGINLPKPVINPQSLEFNFTNEGGIGGNFRFSKNIMGLWVVQECRRTWSAAGHDYTYATLAEMAASASRHVAVIDVDASDFLKPGDMPTRILEYCQRSDQKQPGDEATIVRVTLEGIALKYRWVLERLEELTGRKLPTIHIIGGGTQNRLLSQFTADATGRTVITGPIEATAIGNILTQAMAMGKLNNLEEACEVVRHSFEPQIFQPENRSGWDDAYAKLISLMK